MCDVEQITEVNQKQRRWAEDVDARIAAQEQKAAKKALEAKRRKVRAQTVRVCYMVMGVFSALAGIAGAEAVVSSSVNCWIVAAACLGIGMLFHRLANAWDVEV